MFAFYNKPTHSIWYFMPLQAAAESHLNTGRSVTVLG